MSTDLDVLLIQNYSEGTVERWLGLDLSGGDRLVDLDAPDRPATGGVSQVLISPVTESCAALPDGHLLLPTGVLWSLVDPLGASRQLQTGWMDRTQTETVLREQGRRFRARAHWWQSLELDLRTSLRSLTKGFQPDLGPLFDWLDRVPSTPGEAVDPTPPPEAAVRASNPESPHAQFSGSAEDLYAWFQDPEGLGALYGDNWKPRSEQAQMAREVAQALTDGTALLIEAGTGVGKTLAYLIPLLAQVNRSGGRAAVSTHTRALQRQVLEQDLPRLQPLLGDRDFALLMGRRNYLCLRQRLAYGSRHMMDLDSALRAIAFRLWLKVTSEGMREELAHHPLLGADVQALFDGADLCLPGQCYEGDRCYVQRARRRARDADLLVINHSLLMHDLQTEGAFLGDLDLLVVDEAHRLPEVTLDAHTVACGLWRQDEISELLGGASGRTDLERINLVASRLGAFGADGLKAAAACEDFGKSVRRVFKAYREWWKALGARIDEVLPGPEHRLGRIRVRDKDEAFASLRGPSAVLLTELAEAGEAYSRLGRTASVLEDLSSGLEDDLAQLAQAGQLVRALETDVRFLVITVDEKWVTWVDPGSTKGVRRLGATLLEAGDVLRDYWTEAPYAPVMTSATLAVGEDFSHMLGELGLTRRQPRTETSTCPSPFDYHRQSLFLVPGEFPSPGSPAFSEAVGDLMTTLGLRIPRKSLGLFTSYRLIDEVKQIMNRGGLNDDPRLTRGPVLLSQQPGVSPPSLLTRFRAHRRAVLLGTTTFWEGVDFPGEDLEILVVTKLPFLVPNDPWVEARCERLSAMGENPFTSFMVRDAVLRLRQGFGRLIRRVTDRGVVIILDNRLHTKNYGVTFLSALPTVPVAFNGTEDLVERVEDFFNRPL